MKNRKQRSDLGSMLIRRLFGIYDSVMAYLEKRDEEKLDCYSSCFCSITICGFSIRVVFYPHNVRWRVRKSVNDSHEGTHQYLNTASETIDSLVSTIVKHVGNGSKN